MTLRHPDPRIVALAHAVHVRDRALALLRACAADLGDVDLAAEVRDFLSRRDTERTPAVTKAQFEQAYAERSRTTVDRLHARGMHAYPCACGEDICEGWQMLRPEALVDQLELRRLRVDLA